MRETERLAPEAAPQGITPGAKPKDRAEARDSAARPNPVRPSRPGGRGAPATLRAALGPTIARRTRWCATSRPRRPHSEPEPMEPRSRSHAAAQAGEPVARARLLHLGSATSSAKKAARGAHRSWWLRRRRRTRTSTARKDFEGVPLAAEASFPFGFVMARPRRCSSSRPTESSRLPAPLSGGPSWISSRRPKSPARPT